MKIEKSKMLGFDQDGLALWDVAVSEDVTEAGRVAKPSGNEGKGGISAPAGMIKGDWPELS